MPYRLDQDAVVAGQQRIEAPFQAARQAPGGRFMRLREQACAHHRRQGQRHQRRDGDRDRHGDGEFLEHAPDHPAHQQQRNEHRHQGDGDREDGEADLTGAIKRGLHRRLAHLDMPGDVLDHDDRVINHEADGDRQPHQRQVVQAVAEQVHHPEGADDRDRHRDGGNDRRPGAAQEQEDHAHHQADGEQQGELHVGDRGADRGRAIRDHREPDGGRDRRFQLRQRLLDRLHSADHVGPGQPLDREHDAAAAVDPAHQGAVLRPDHRLADVFEADRAPIAIGDDLAVPFGRRQDLVVGLQGVGAPSAVQAAFGLIDADVGQRGAHILEVEPICRELARVELKPDRRMLLATDADLPDARHLRELLRQDALGVVVDGRDRQGLRGDAEHQDRRIGRVRFAVGGRRRHVLGKLARRRVDRRLHQLRRRIDVVVQRELQHDLGVAQRTRRGHLREVRNLAELFLERRGHRGGHGLRIRPRQFGRDGYGGIRDGRQRSDRQQPIGGAAQQHDRDHQQRCCDRPADEWG